jgi:hypothetical protein
MFSVIDAQYAKVSSSDLWTGVSFSPCSARSFGNVSVASRAIILGSIYMLCPPAVGLATKFNFWKFTDNFFPSCSPARSLVGVTFVQPPLALNVNGRSFVALY